MSSQKTILTITVNPSIDKNSGVDYVVAERKLRCQAPVREPGGGGINVSRALKNLGGESTLLYLAGGPFGQILQSLLDQENLDHRPILIQGWTRENLIVLEESTGRQFRFGMPGPEVQESEWQRCLEHISRIKPKPDYIIGSGSLPPGVPADFFARVARLSKGIGSLMILDTSGEALRLAAEEGVYLMKPNLREMKELTGREILDEADELASARELAKKNEVVVLSLGVSGALLVTKNICRRFRSPRVAVRSTVGAGDSMVAALVLALARGQSIEEAVLFGVAAGASAVMRPGGALCERKDTERLCRQMEKDA